VEPTGGLFVLAPVLLALLAAPFLRGRRRLEGELRAVLLALVAIAAGLVVIAAVAFWGATMRYEVDFASFLLIAGLLVWFHLGKVAVRRRRLVTVAGVLTIIWGSLFGLALSFTGSYTLLRATHPDLWNALTRDFSLVSRVGASVTNGGPTLAEVSSPGGVDRQHANYLTFDDQGTSLWMTPQPAYLRVVMPSSGTMHLHANALRGPGAPPRTRLDLVVTLPGGATQQVPMTADGPIDVPLKLKRGVQDLSVAVALQAQPTQPAILLLQDVRADDH
jgi:hypothetical protein